MSEQTDILYPLTQYYQTHRIAKPDVVEIKGEDMAEPYRSLLVHRLDMTGTLASFYQSLPSLSVLENEQTKNVLMRRVVLYIPTTRQKVEFGEIKIYLDCFDVNMQEMITAGEVPLGEILKKHQFDFISSPISYFKLLCDEMIGGVLDIEVGETLYGRKNQLQTPSGKLIADIIEILPLSKLRGKY